MHPKTPISPRPPLSPADSTTRKRPSPSSSEISSSKIPPPTTPHATTFAGPAERKGSKSSGSGGGPTISRSIQACNRCRARKTRCDQQFPSCSACLKAGVECVGIDAATGREIPRSYVDWLEKRVKHLEEELKLEQQGANNNVAIDPQLQPGWGDAGNDGRNGPDTGSFSRSSSTVMGDPERSSRDQTPRNDIGESKALHLRPDIENLVNQVGLVGVQGTSSPGFMGGSSGISFARLMFSAVKLRSKDGEQTSTTPPLSYPNQDPTPETMPPDPAASSTVIPRSLKRSPPCPFPNRETAEHLLEAYFQQANPQFPILFRPQFEAVFRRVCDRVEIEGTTTPCDLGREGSGSLYLDRIQHSADLYFAFMCFAIASSMSQSSENLPERYHAAAMQHMDCLFMSVSVSNNRLDGLKGVLLLALYSLMRPAAPGVWYVLGAALRLAVDIGLHQENAKAEKMWDPVSLDERRRLFWCTYSLDRQVCVYLGRPFGISDDAIRTPFPVDVDDECITVSGIRPQPLGRKSSRTISLHMFRIRQLQSEIQQILYQTSEIPRRFQTLEVWRRDMEARLQHWIDTAPKNQGEAGCGYNLSFIDLNYQQIRLLLYGLCPAVPQPTTEAYEIIADSGSKIIKAYRHLHREKSINYSWIACHNLFMAGTSYLCALWQSPEVRAATTIDQIDFHTLACVDVLSSMIERCPAAQTCRDIFDSLASSTVQLCSSDYASRSSSHRRPVKRFRPDTQQPEWTTSEYPTATPVPASLANLLHHPAPNPEHNAYRQHYEVMAYSPQHQEIDPIFRNGGFLEAQPRVEMTAGMDGRGLFEMIQEVGSSGGAGFLGYEGSWGGLDTWVMQGAAL